MDVIDASGGLNDESAQLLGPKLVDIELGCRDRPLEKRSREGQCMERLADALLLIRPLPFFLPNVDNLLSNAHHLLLSTELDNAGHPMLIIQWLNRLPDTDRIVVAKKTATNCGSADEANAEAFRLWPDIRTAQDHRPDGFQVVDQDGRSIQLAKFVIEGAPSA